MVSTHAKTLVVFGGYFQNQFVPVVEVFDLSDEGRAYFMYDLSQALPQSLKDYRLHTQAIWDHSAIISLINPNSSTLQLLQCDEIGTRVTPEKSVPNLNGIQGLPFFRLEDGSINYATLNPE